jgi:hypothetical protein
MKQDPQVVTVLDTICIKSFQACFHCSRSTGGDKPPYKCEAEHVTETQIWKYILDLDVSYNNTQSVFTLWDQHKFWEYQQLIFVTK